MTHPVPETTVQEAARQAQAGEVLLLDVREPAEWAAGRAEGALHLPLGELSLEGLPTDRPIVVVCRSGNRSGKATVALLDAGVAAVNMAGGMLAWAAAGLPVVNDEGPRGTIA